MGPVARGICRSIRNPPSIDRRCWEWRCSQTTGDATEIAPTMQAIDMIYSAGPVRRPSDKLVGQERRQDAMYLISMWHRTSVNMWRCALGTCRRAWRHRECGYDDLHGLGYRTIILEENIVKLSRCLYLCNLSNPLAGWGQMLRIDFTFDSTSTLQLYFITSLHVFSVVSSSMFYIPSSQRRLVYSTKAIPQTSSQQTVGHRNRPAVVE